MKEKSKPRQFTVTTRTTSTLSPVPHFFRPFSGGKQMRHRLTP